MSVPSAQEKPSKTLDFEKQVYDSVHGYIGITEVERAIIDTSVFQRLRRIRQLGLSDFVYPGATHSRFAHSIGSMFVMDKIAHRLIEDEFLQENDLQDLRLAALLHDVGHFPFSHLVENVMKKRHGDQGKHEKLSSHIIKKTEIKEKIMNAGYDSEKISAIVERRHENKLFSYLLSSDLDVDRIDYLIRDAHHTGVAYGFVDVDRLIRTMTVNKKTRAQLAIAQKGRQAIENFLIGRYHMYQSVYYHKTTMAFELMMEKIYDGLLEEKFDGAPDLKDILKFDQNDLAKYDDFSVWHQMINYDGDSGFLKELIKMLTERQPIKLVYQEPSLAMSKEKSSIWRVLLVPRQKKMLSQDSGVEEEWIFVSEPPPVELIISGEKETAIYVERDGDYSPLVDDDTSIAHHLKDFRYFTPRLYTKKQYVENLKKSLKSCLDLNSS